MMKTTKTILKGTIWLGRGTATIMGLAMLLALTVGLTSTALAGTGVGARFHLGKINTINNATTQLVGSVRAPMLAIANQSDGRVCVAPATERLAANSPGGPPPSPGPGGPPQSCSTSPAPALGLTVRPGQTPLTVNSEAGTAKNLSADELDGKDSTAFASATNGKASDADKLDGKDSSAFVSSTIGTAPNANHLDGQDSTRFFSGRTYIISNEIFGTGPNGLGEVSASCDPGDAVLSGGFTGISFTTTEKGFVTDIVTESFPVDSRTWQVDFANKAFPNGNHSVFAICADFPPLR